jgi:hypothetical protein
MEVDDSTNMNRKLEPDPLCRHPTHIKRWEDGEDGVHSIHSYLHDQNDPTKAL